MGWNKRPDFFRSAMRELNAKRELVEDAMGGLYALEEDLVRALLWHHLFAYHECCRQLGNGLRDESIKLETGVYVNSRPVDTTKLALELLEYENELTFEKGKCGR